MALCFGILNLLFYARPQSTLWIENCFKKKDNYAKSILDNKIVFTSGSNTLYGMETHLIEKQLNVPVVNMAIHAGLGTDYILYRAKQVLKSGDIIVIPFEYENFIWDGKNDETRTDYILSHDKNYFFKELNLLEQLTMIYSIPPIKLINSLKEQFRISEEAKIGEGYSSLTLNKNGDETFKTGMQKIVLNSKPFKLPRFNSTLGLLKIKDFDKWCKNNNIKLFITFPNTINHEEYYKETYTNYFDFLIKYFFDNEIEIIGKPTDSLYPVEYFYDTKYHLNIEGSKIRTNEFLNKLKIALLK
jgi:hypothetical protein